MSVAENQNVLGIRCNGSAGATRGIPFGWCAEAVRTNPASANEEPARLPLTPSAESLRLNEHRSQCIRSCRELANHGGGEVINLDFEHFALERPRRLPDCFGDGF